MRKTNSKQNWVDCFLKIGFYRCRCAHNKFCERKFIAEPGKEKEKFKKRLEKLNLGVKRNHDSLPLLALFIPIFYGHLATDFLQKKLLKKNFQFESLARTFVFIMSSYKINFCLLSFMFLFLHNQYL